MVDPQYGRSSAWSHFDGQTGKVDRSVDGFANRTDPGELHQASGIAKEHDTDSAAGRRITQEKCSWIRAGNG
jgi:hypothetical protein